ncbi:SAM-dependent DNA methyltransferase [Corynebacterium sp. 320]|uniref:class I SAM-dependent DNA methyltransferase n=1 Tax=Corynebacterium TaxID=1716 RepID=UPI00125CBC9A|nr:MULTISPECIES: class I SAM-dependent DNA methyltransferase [Corynebacterium]KAB1501317.1 SAM-dependent DNA methyltransferase [Corynebacterium sp. 320]KAB1551486.1 SAM-dependent DNA methyltransferase [Corynebacterium sp. 321]KAB1551686.1 SAM-dependent DNA methyltransferase [Corynebacterium sp. 319]KAB3525682.1 SAM-dependent DNA methyltransferase [Corynebacterium sp. 250]KAB3538676.1 SAM-dependent DNA methyltransferase [Corynebacterium sp. 366]
MITGALKTHVDRIWDTFWSGGISNPITVIEQFTFLLFIKNLDDRQVNIDKRLALADPTTPPPIFDRDQQHLRWRNLINDSDLTRRKRTISTEVFDFIKTMGGTGYQQHMTNATFEIESEATLARVMELIDSLTFSNRDLTGDLYEYMLDKLSTSGKNGQFRTPSHIIDLIVSLMEPTPQQRVIDPACGTAGFLVAANDWIKSHHRSELFTKTTRESYNSLGLTGFDFDKTMVRIAAMNMFMHGFEEPNISYRDSLQQLDAVHHEAYDLVLANPPFAGSLDKETIDPALKAVTTSKKTELLFLNRFLQLLKPGGRAAVIVPEGVLFGSTKAHKVLRQHLVEDQRLDAVIKLPSGVFKPYSGVSTAILCFTRTDSGGTDDVWFYDVTADGFSLDDKRTPLLEARLLGPAPLSHIQDLDDPDFAADPQPVTLTAEQAVLNNLPDVVARWHQRTTTERDRARTEYSFTVPREEIAAAGFDLSMNRYKEIILEATETRDPLEIIAEIETLDQDIAAGLAKLKAMLTEGK